VICGIQTPLNYLTFVLAHKGDEQKLLLFERKILRKIYRPTLITRNQEITKGEKMKGLKQFSTDQNICKCLKGKRLEWAGHIQNLGTTRI